MVYLYMKTYTDFYYENKKPQNDELKRTHKNRGQNKIYPSSKKFICKFFNFVTKIIYIKPILA